MLHTPDTSTIRFRLTALWALSECGLGGAIHALRIPFSGLVLGGFAVVILTLLAYFSPTRKAQNLLKSTLLVLAVKIMVTPYSPPPAHLAVLFQGVVAAVGFSLIPNVSLAAMLVGFLAIVESAFQKILILTLLFGETLWKALDVFLAQVIRPLMPVSDNASWWLLGVYGLVHGLWGIYWGYWAAGFAKKLPSLSTQTLEGFEQVKATVSPLNSGKPRSALYGVAPMLLILVVVLVWSSNNQQVLWLLARTTIAISIFVLLRPLYSRLVNKWVGKRRHYPEIQKTLTLAEEYKMYVTPAYEMARPYKGIRFYTRFLQHLIILSLYAPR